MFCYWPEIHKYCGCCSLNTGILIRSILGMVLNITIVIGNCILIFYFFEMTNYLKLTSPETLVAYIDKNITEADYHVATLIQRILLSYFIAWLLLKVIHVLTIFGVLYALFKEKPTILKYYLYINVPNWILDLFVTAIAAVLSSLWIKSVVLICILSEGYNLLAINTAYKKMTGKSRVITDDDLNNVENEVVVNLNGFISPPPYDTISLRNNNNNEQAHCRTCTCNITPTLANSPQIETISENSVNSTTEQTQASLTEEDKELNFKEDPIIFDQNQLLERNSAVVDRMEPKDETRPQISHLNPNLAVDNRPTTLALRNRNCDENKDLADIPVIYDEEQLNVGTSPIIEDRMRNTAQCDNG